MTWSYKPRQLALGGGFVVVEHYDMGGAHTAETEGVTPYGESLDELIQDLEMMLADVRRYAEEEDK